MTEFICMDMNNLFYEAYLSSDHMEDVVCLHAKTYKQMTAETQS